MFSRREIQKRIDFLGSRVAPSKLEVLVKRLNDRGKSSIEAQWELVVLAALFSAGSVSDEPKLGNS